MIREALPVAVIGASGLIGSHLYRQTQAAGATVYGTYLHNGRPDLSQLDICDAAAVESWLSDVNPDVVYLPAALPNVEFCELHPPQSYAINVVGVRNVVTAARHVGARLVYFSSDYVFDGMHGPYREDDLPNPISIYGWHKLLAEHYIALWAQDYLIIRTTVVYGREQAGKNFVYRLLASLRAEQPIPVPADQVGSPTYAPDLAQAAIRLVEAGTHGLWHLSGPTLLSRYALACKAAQVFGLDQRLIQAVTTDQLHQQARRPLNAGLVADKAQSFLGAALVDHRVGLALMAEDINRSGWSGDHPTQAELGS